MAEAITVVIFVGSMALMALYTYYILRPAAKTPCTKLIFPVGEDSPIDIRIRQALQLCSGMRDCHDFEFVVLDLGADPDTLRRIELLQRDHPFLQVTEPGGLEKTLCNPPLNGV